jgi:hypothetical protein
LQVRAHHSVINHDESVWGTLLDLCGNGHEISNFEERVGGALQKNHSSFPCCNVLVKIFRVGGVNMMHDDAAVSFEISEKAIRATVEIIASDHLITWLEKTEDDIKRGHPGGDGKCMARRGYLCDVVFCKAVGCLNRQNRSDTYQDGSG